MNPFTLVRLPTLDAARERVAAEPERRTFRAGGIDLIDRMKEGLDAPDELVELQAIAGEHGSRMRGIVNTDEGGWRIGALVTLGQLEGYDDLPSAYGALKEAASHAATPSIRNGATAGGNLLQRPRCWYFRHSDLLCLKKGGYECLAVSGDNRYNAILGGGPSFIVHPSSLGSALVALGASVTIAGKKGLRTIPVEELFALPTVDPTKEHTLGPGEVLVSIELPPALAGQRSAYHFAKEKQSQDWPLAEASVRCTVEGGVMREVRVGLGHVARYRGAAKRPKMRSRASRPRQRPSPRRRKRPCRWRNHSKATRTRCRSPRVCCATPFTSPPPPPCPIEERHAQLRRSLPPNGRGRCPGLPSFAHQSAARLRPRHARRLSHVALQ